MRKIETQIVIAASPTVVWDCLMDFQSYGEWNPFLISVEGQATEGSVLKNTIRLNEKKQMTFQPEVLVVNSEKEFRWKGKMMIRGLFDGEHSFQLESKEGQQTLLTHNEKFTGLLTPLFMPMIQKDTLNGFVRMNEALKQLAEAKAKGEMHVI